MVVVLGAGGGFRGASLTGRCPTKRLAFGTCVFGHSQGLEVGPWLADSTGYSPQLSPLHAVEMHYPPEIGPLRPEGCAEDHRTLGLDPLPSRVPFVAPMESLQMAEERSRPPCPSPPQKPLAGAPLLPPGRPGTCQSHLSHGGRAVAPAPQDTILLWLGEGPGSTFRSSWHCSSVLGWGLAGAAAPSGGAGRDFRLAWACLETSNASLII